MDLRILFPMTNLLLSHAMRLDILKMIVSCLHLTIFILAQKNSLTNAIMMDDGRIAISVMVDPLQLLIFTEKNG